MDSILCAEGTVQKLLYFEDYHTFLSSLARAEKET